MTILPLLISAALGQAEAAGPALTPQGKWNVEYAEDMCVLSRTYGSVDKPIVLGFKPAPMSEDLRVVVISAGRAGFSSGTARIVAGANGSPVERPFISGSPRGKSIRLTAIDIKRTDLQPIDAGGRLAIKAGRGVDQAFSIEQFEIARKGLAACETDLLKSWGMTDAMLAAIATPPTAIGSLAAFLSDSDYPDAAIRSGEQGTSGIRFLVKEDGSLNDCHVIESSGSALLDQTSCRLIMARAKFQPAADRDGKPVTSFSFTRIRWVLPD